MIPQNLSRLPILLGALTASCVAVRADQVNMLWNHELRYRSFVHYNHTGERPTSGCDLSQGHLTGAPAGNYKCLMANGSYVQASNGSQPSVRWCNLNYTDSQHKQYPGYDMWVTSHGVGNPIEFMFANNSKTAATAKLNEVGFMFEHWPNNPGKWAFREQFRLGDFSKIQANLQLRLKSFSASNHANWRTCFITADFRINYYDNNGVFKRNDLICIILSNPNGYDHWGASSDVYYYKSGDGTQVMLHANKLGITNVQSVQSNYTTISFDYLPLTQQYLPPPPPGCTYDNAVVDGWDIYSCTMLADFSFYVKAPSLVGTRP